MGNHKRGHYTVLHTGCHEIHERVHVVLCQGVMVGVALSLIIPHFVWSIKLKVLHCTICLLSNGFSVCDLYVFELFMVH